MEYDCGIDVSVEQSSVCVVDAEGSILREATVGSDPEVLTTDRRETSATGSKLKKRLTNQRALQKSVSGTALRGTSPGSTLIF